MKTFMTKVLAGEIQNPGEAIDDAVEAWHKSRSRKPLHEYLGMSEAEYELWLTRPSALRIILRGRGYDTTEMYFDEQLSKKVHKTPDPGKKLKRTKRIK